MFIDALIQDGGYLILLGRVLGYNFAYFRVKRLGLFLDVGAKRSAKGVQNPKKELILQENASTKNGGL